MTSHEHVVDPVCGMTITTVEAPYTSEHAGTTYYLCSAICSQRFALDADAYATVARLDLPGWGQTPHPPDIVERFRRDGAAPEQRDPSC
jgi:YHS domain-containing protein